MAFKNQFLTTNVILRELNKDAKNNYQYFIVFNFSKDTCIARIHDLCFIVPYLYTRLYIKIIYPIKIHHVYISAIVDEIINTVYKSTKKRIEAKNEGCKIPKIC